jgi:hypothetical protein
MGVIRATAFNLRLALPVMIDKLELIIAPAREQHFGRAACPANLELFDKTEADLIPKCKGLIGAAAMIQDMMDGECRVLTF